MDAVQAIKRRKLRINQDNKSWGAPPLPKKRKKKTKYPCLSHWRLARQNDWLLHLLAWKVLALCSDDTLWSKWQLEKKKWIECRSSKVFLARAAVIAATRNNQQTVISCIAPFLRNHALIFVMVSHIRSQANIRRDRIWHPRIIQSQNPRTIQGFVRQPSTRELFGAGSHSRMQCQQRRHGQKCLGAWVTLNTFALAVVDPQLRQTHLPSCVPRFLGRRAYNGCLLLLHTVVCIDALYKTARTHILQRGWLCSR